MCEFAEEELSDLLDKRKERQELAANKEKARSEAIATTSPMHAKS
jgi:hypothetical protein